jgi:hypothetical protein
MKLSDETKYRLRMLADQADAEFTTTALEALAAELGALARELREQAAKEPETEGAR